jgi:hypothetical protein
MPTIKVNDQEPNTVRFWLLYIYTNNINFGTTPLNEAQQDTICTALINLATDMRLHGLRAAAWQVLGAHMA